MKYVLSPDTRIVIQENSINLRKGIWNIENAELDWNSVHKDDKEIMQNLFQSLRNTRQIDSNDWSNLSKDSQNIWDLLITNHFLLSEESPYMHDASELYVRGTELEKASELNEIFIISDNMYIHEIAEKIFKENNIKAVYPTDEEYEFLNQIHDLNQVVHTSYEDHLNKIVQITKNLPILVLQENINLSMIRAINRAIPKGSYLLTGCIDGPFMLYVSIVSKISPCFECYENRMLSRLEDHTLYQKFVNESTPKNNRKNPAILAAMTFLIHQAFSDVISIKKLGKSQFSSRALHIYLPTFEVQYQDILRIPNCPACGNLSNQYYTSCDHTSLKNIFDPNK